AGAVVSQRVNQQQAVQAFVANGQVRWVGLSRQANQKNVARVRAVEDSHALAFVARLQLKEFSLERGAQDVRVRPAPVVVWPVTDELVTDVVANAEDQAAAV